MRTSIRITAAVVVMAALYGTCFLIEARPERHTSWTVYLGLAFLMGLIAVGAELAGEFVSAPDRVSDPLAKRLGRLLLLLASVVVLGAILYALLRIM